MAFPGWEQSSYHSPIRSPTKTDHKGNHRQLSFHNHSCYQPVLRYIMLIILVVFFPSFIFRNRRGDDDAPLLQQPIL